MVAEYVICMHDNRVEIVGPFVSETAAADYGREWQKREGDRPTWQCVTLPQGIRSVRFIAAPETVAATASTSTFGGKAVGLSFNPSGDSNVHRLKALYAEVIDVLNDLRKGDRSERARLCSVAITEAQGAQMWAVKAATWKED